MVKLTGEALECCKAIERAIKDCNNATLIWNLVALEKTGERLVDIVTPAGQNLLQFIFSQQLFDPATIRFLLNKGFNPNMEINGIPALLYCLDAYETEIAKLLIKHNANVNCSNEGGHTPLMWAAKAGDIKFVQLLIKNGADLYAQDYKGDSALIWAIRNIQPEIVEIVTPKLLSDDEIKKSLIEAATNSSIEIFEYLLDLASSSELLTNEFLKILQIAATDNDGITKYLKALDGDDTRSLRLECTSTDSDSYSSREEDADLLGFTEEQEKDM